MDLSQAEETAKRVLMKEKIDRQLVGQSSLTPFMNMRDNSNKGVTFNMTDDIEQKLDKLTVMMGKLVTENEGQSKQFKPQVTNPKEVEVRIEVGLGQIMLIEIIQDIVETLEVEQGIVQVIEVVKVTIQEVIRGTGEIIIITIIEEVIIGIKVMIGIGVDHMKGRVEIGEIIEV